MHVQPDRGAALGIAAIVLRARPHGAAFAAESIDSRAVTEKVKGPCPFGDCEWRDDRDATRWALAESDLRALTAEAYRTGFHGQD